MAGFKLSHFIVHTTESKKPDSSGVDEQASGVLEGSGNQAWLLQRQDEGSQRNTRMHLEHLGGSPLPSSWDTWAAQDFSPTAALEEALSSHLVLISVPGSLDRLFLPSVTIMAVYPHWQFTRQSLPANTVGAGV